MGVNVEISGRENSKELLRPESMVKSLAFGQARWDDPLKDFEDRTVWLAKWEMSGRAVEPDSLTDSEQNVAQRPPRQPKQHAKRRRDEA